MNYYKKVKSAFDDWATTYESDVVPKLDLRGYSYDELAKTILSYYDKSMDKKSILELGVGTGVLGERVKSLVPSTEIDGLDISSEMLKRSKEKAVYNHLYLGSADEHLYTEQYAFVYSAFMFHSVKGQDILLSKIAECLVNGGMFILVDLIPNMKILANIFIFGIKSTSINIPPLTKHSAIFERRMSCPFTLWNINAEYTKAYCSVYKCSSALPKYK